MIPHIYNILFVLWWLLTEHKQGMVMQCSMPWCGSFSCFIQVQGHSVFVCTTIPLAICLLTGFPKLTDKVSVHWFCHLVYTLLYWVGWHFDSFILISHWPSGCQNHVCIVHSCIRLIGGSGQSKGICPQLCVQLDNAVEFVHICKC